jgi:hypothetical protein
VVFWLSVEFSLRLIILKSPPIKMCSEDTDNTLTQIVLSIIANACISCSIVTHILLLQILTSL